MLMPGGLAIKISLRFILVNAHKIYALCCPNFLPQITAVNIGMRSFHPLACAIRECACPYQLLRSESGLVR